MGGGEQVGGFEAPRETGGGGGGGAGFEGRGDFWCGVWGIASGHERGGDG